MKKSMLKKATAVFAASALACGALAVPALAVESPISKTSTSEVTVTKAEAGQISVTIPQLIPVVANTDGTFLTPDAKYTTIANASNFPVKISKVEAKEVDSAKMALVAANGELTKSEGDPIKMWMTVSTGGNTLDLKEFSTAGGKAVTSDKWTMASGDGTLNVSVAGAMTNVADEISAVHALDVVWTVAI